MNACDKRQKDIIHLLAISGKVKVDELSEKFKVAPATIRRDLAQLESQHKLRRTHGGAVKISFLSEEPAIDIRRHLYINEKIKIASLASRLISDNMSIFLDIGSTVAQMVPLIKEKRNLTVITNAIDVLTALSALMRDHQFNGKLIFLGGEVNALQQTVSGALSESFLERFYIDMAFIGVGGIHHIGGITGYDIHEVSLSRKIIAHSKENIVLVDQSKIGVRNLHQIERFEKIDKIICDVKHPELWHPILEEHDIEWIY